MAAERHHRAALEYWRVNRDAETGGDRVRDGLNISSRLAFDLAAQGRLAEADALLSKGLKEGEALLSSTTLDSSLIHYVAVSHVFRADMIGPRPCNSLNDRALAERELRRATGLYRDLLARDAKDDTAMEMYAECLIRQAALSESAPRRESLGREAMAIIAPRSEQNPDNADLALSRLRGLSLVASASTLPLYERLAMRFPERTDFRLAWIDALLAAGQHDRARGLAADLKRQFPSNADFSCRAE